MSCIPQAQPSVRTKCLSQDYIILYYTTLRSIIVSYSIIWYYFGHLRSSGSGSYLCGIRSSHLHLWAVSVHAAETEITAKRLGERAGSWELIGLCATLFLYLLTILFLFYRRILGPGSSGYRTGAYDSSSEGDCSDSYWCPDWNEVSLLFLYSMLLLILSCIIHFSLLTVYIRTDKVQSFEDKVTKVQQILGKK